MKEQIHEDPKIVAAAERQMTSWSMDSALQDRHVHFKNFPLSAAKALRYVTISREAGAGGSSIAKIVGGRLGWEVLDKELLDRIAQRFHNNRLMLDLVDETPSNWVYDVLGTWMDRKVIPHETYVAQLGRIILAAAKRGNVVFVGRGAQFLLPRDQGFSVRLVASESFRIENLVRTKEFSAAESKKYMHEIEHGRFEFGRRFFHHDITDPHLYDVVVNTERLGLEGSAELILAAMANRVSKPAKIEKN